MGRKTRKGKNRLRSQIGFTGASVRHEIKPPQIEQIGQLADFLYFDGDTVARLEPPGGVAAIPIPCGVPVRITVPGNNVPWRKGQGIPEI